MLIGALIGLGLGVLISDGSHRPWAKGAAVALATDVILSALLGTAVGALVVWLL